jgi:hypothetical protein
MLNVHTNKNTAREWSDRLRLVSDWWVKFITEDIGSFLLTLLTLFFFVVKPNATQDEIDDIIDADDQSPIFAQSVRGKRSTNLTSVENLTLSKHSLYH